MKRRWRRIPVAIILALASFAGVLINAAPAEAQLWHTVPWTQGRWMTDWYGTGSWMTSGIWLNSLTNDHMYYWTVRHGHECSYGVGFGSGSCPFLSKYEASNSNKYDGAVGQIWFPNGAFSSYDMMLVDFGLRNQQIAKSFQIWNYCNPYPNCQSSHGGGTSPNPNWAGTPMTINGYLNSVSVDQSVCASGARTGTFCGTIHSAQQISYSGYTQWAWLVKNLSNCKNGGGNSGGPVYTYPGDGYAYAAGMIVASSVLGQDQILPGDPCIGPANPPPQWYARDMYYIPWTSARDAWPTLNLRPYNQWT